MSSRMSWTPTRENSLLPKTPGGATQASSSLKPLTLGTNAIASGPRPLQLSGISNHEAASTILSSNNIMLSGLSSPTNRPGLSRLTSASGRGSGNSSPRPGGAINSEKDGSSRRNPKRMSSICYSSSSRDVVPNTPSSNNAFRSPAIDRLNSLPSPAPALHEELRMERASAASKRTSVIALTTEDGERDNSPDLTSSPKPPPALTLTEKHADLLRFIASKESKCYELRTQLEQHEAELLVLKKKWERIVSKSKPEGVNANGSRDGGGGESVRFALKEVGRLLVSGGMGLMDDSTSPASSTSTKGHSPSSPSMAQSSTVKTATPSGPKPAEVIRSSSEIARSSGSGPRVSLTETRSRKSKEEATLSSPRTSLSSPTSSFMTTSGASSTRDSLSSVSTSMSSSLEDVTPSSKVALSSSSAAQPPSSALDDLARSTKPWIPLPNGLNKTWENIQKTTTFGKHSKRASILVSDVTDMSTSILGSLSTALLSSGGASSSPAMTMAGHRRSPVPTPVPAAQRLSAASLLDDDDDILMSLGSNLSAPIKPWSSSASTSSPILKPVAVPPTPSKTSIPSKKQNKCVYTDDEDWNW
ncbi:hypothetical protein FRB94_003859 [Tulasnella sp. JGI-2019a]|nr:hypothetical protein FRB94_003859 [Tulasnella sp. JGI-2019a]